MSVFNYKGDYAKYEYSGNDVRMILWAGDCVHDDVTDIERLPNFDVYVCLGFPETINQNIAFLKNRSNGGVICLLDIQSSEQMNRFLDTFRGKVKLLESDYNGNTPVLKQEYYQELLQADGIAHNIDGINCIIMPTEEYQNTLEVLGPVLPSDLNAKRFWTDELINVAIGSQISPSAAWSSPDLKQPYYDGVRSHQEAFTLSQMKRNLNRSTSYMYTLDTIESYWDLLPNHILTTNFERVCSRYNDLRDIFAPLMYRFHIFLRNRTEPYMENKSEFVDYVSSKNLSVLQNIYKLCMKYPGIKFGYYMDTRKSEIVYGHFILKSQ